MTYPNDPISFHRRIVKKAVQTAWNHKHLWIVGFFATFAGFGGAFEALYRVYDRVQGIVPAAGAQLGMDFLPGLETIKALISFAPSPWLALALYALFGLLIFAVFAWVVVMALGATVSCLQAISKGQDLDFAEALKAAGKRFWRLLGVIVLVKLTSLATATVIGVNLVRYNNDHDPLSGLFFFLSFAFYAALAVVIALVGVYSALAVIDGNLSVSEAVRKGWRTFADNWLISVEAGVLIVLIQLAAVLMFVGALFLVSAPFIFLMMLTVLFNLPSMAMIVAVLAAIAAVLLMCILAAFMTVFQVSVWWQLWQEFGQNKLKAGLERWLYRLGRYFGRIGDVG